MTAHQRSLVAYLARYIAAKGISPSHRETRVELCLGSEADGIRLVQILEESGDIIRVHSRHRSIGMADRDADLSSVSTAALKKELARRPARSSNAIEHVVA